MTAPDSVDSGQPDRSAQRPDRRVVFVTDAQLGLHLDGAAVVLVGADSLLPDGSTINKAGTLLLAATATALGVPVLVAADRFKLAAWWRPGDPVDLDAMPAAEVWAEAPPGIVVRNVYFDRAPARFISGIITERGRLDPADLEAVADRLATRFGEVYGWRRGASA